MQVASSTIFESGWSILPDDGRTTIPGWVVPDATNPPVPGSFVWAPDVARRVGILHAVETIETEDSPG